MDKITKLVIQIEYDGVTRVFGFESKENVQKLLADNPGIADIIEQTLAREPKETKLA